jgi:uncharacterized protein YndB with AHSA1/START domain
MPERSNANEIRITRIYDASVETVWDAWTDPDQVAQWWGPRGFTTTTYSKDVSPGGSWVYNMRGPDGTDYPSRANYLEVEKYTKLVYDHGASDDLPPLFRVIVLFSDLKGKTKLEMSMTLPTPEAAEETRLFIKKVGGYSTWDRLSEYLEKEASGKEKFVITRSFNAPQDLMFEVWTNPKHLTQWLPPSGFEMQLIRSDIKPGGSIFYLMTGNNLKMYGRAEYLEIEKPRHLVYIQQFCDENEKVSRHPMAPTWPETMLTTVDLAEEGSEQTRVTVTWEPYGSTTPEELETFIKSKGGMTQGWTGSFDKLESYLGNL